MHLQGLGFGSLFNTEGIRYRSGAGMINYYDVANRMPLAYFNIGHEYHTNALTSLFIHLHYFVGSEFQTVSSK